MNDSDGSGIKVANSLLFVLCNFSCSVKCGIFLRVQVFLVTEEGEDKRKETEKASSLHT